MGRRRTSNLHLPPRLQLESGTYYTIVPASGYRHSDGVVQTTNPECPHYAAVYKAEWDRSGSEAWTSKAKMMQWASLTDAEVLAVRLDRSEVWEWVNTMRRVE